MVIFLRLRFSYCSQIAISIAIQIKAIAPVTKNPMTFPDIKAAVIIEDTIIISNNTIITLNTRFSFISLPLKALYDFLLVHTICYIIN